MKRVWKWIIGIVVVLLVLAALVTVPFAMHYRLGPQAAYVIQQRDVDGGYGPGGMMGRNDKNGFGYGGYGPGDFNHGGMMGRGYGFRYPMMRGFGFLPFGFFMLIIPLAILGLAIYGFIALANRRPAAPAPVEVTPVAPTQTCANCGKPTQSDWKNCPYCGNSL
jgi:hypothetical protein